MLLEVSGNAEAFNTIATSLPQISGGADSKLMHTLIQQRRKIYSSHDVDRPKPFPDVYLHAAQQMGFQPEECVVIEDSVPGVQAAYAAGMTVFGYTSHQPIETHRDALVAAGANVVFEQMQQLPNLIDAIKSPQ